MARRPRPKPPAAKAVFINCPFDDEFKRLLRSMVFAIIASGYYPRCALDETDGRRGPRQQDRCDDRRV